MTDPLATCFAAELSAEEEGKKICGEEKTGRPRKEKLLLFFRSEHFFTLGHALLAALLYYLAARIGFLLTLRSYAVSTLWPANAILAAMLLLVPARQTWLILILIFPAHLAVQLENDVPITMVLGWFVSNCTEALLAATGVRWFAGYPVRFDSFRRMAWFIFAGALMAPLMSSFLDVAFVMLNELGTGHYWQVWRMRFFSNVLAMLTIAPVIVMAGTWRRDIFQKIKWQQVIEGLLLTVGLLVAGILVFHEDELPPTLVPTLVYAPLPFLLWAAVRFGPAGLSSSILVTTLLMISGVIHDLGPFSQMSPAQNVFSLQIFLITISVPLMLLSAILQERQSVAKALSESEARFRSAADAAPGMLWMSDPDRRFTFFNQGWLRFRGRPLESELGNGWMEGVHPDDLKSCVETYAASFAQRKFLRLEYRLRRGNGEYGWILDEGAPHYAADGTFRGYIGIAFDITGRKQIENQLNQTQKQAAKSLYATYQQITTLACRLLQTEEAVRRRIARELHDDLNQKLAAHAIALSNLGQAFASGDSSFQEKLGKLQEQAISLGNDIRLIAHELHPSRIEHAGFESMLRSFCSEFSSLTRLEIDLHLEIKSTLPGNVSLCLYRIVQESLHNIAEHAHARKAQVRVQLLARRLILLVADDGVGIDEQKLKTARRLGITSMEERVELVSGEFHISKRRTGGTLIAVEVPLT